MRSSFLLAMIHVALCLTWATASTTPAAEVGTAFTYQGQLLLNGAGFNDTCDLSFSLWDAASNGSMIAGPVNANSTGVVGGVFEAQLDFGAGTVTGLEALYLDITVQCTNDAMPLTLVPRTRITPAPVALALPNLRTEPDTPGDSVNVIAGYGGNSTGAGNGATVAGGGDVGGSNIASGDFSTVCGGLANRAFGVRSTVGGGWVNTADGTHQFIGGGLRNDATAAANFGTVSGGQDNTVSAQFATVPGGVLNTAAGTYALAAGRRAKANHAGSFVWADSTDADFATNADNQFLIRASGGVGINTDTTGGSPNLLGPVNPDVLTVAGVIHATTGGFRFPDGTVQTTAAMGGGGNSNALDAADGNPADAVFVDNDGNVGIGTTSPENRLHVVDADTLQLGGQGGMQLSVAPMLGDRTRTATNGLGTSGQVHLQNSDSQNTIALIGGDSNEGGLISITNGLGAPIETVTINGNQSGKGEILLRNDAGTATVRLAGAGTEEGGVLELLSDFGTSSIVVDGGESKSGGYIRVLDNEGDTSVELENAGGAGGCVSVGGLVGQTTAKLFGNGNGGGASLYLNDSAAQSTLQLHGDTAGSSDASRIIMTDREGQANADTFELSARATTTDGTDGPLMLMRTVDGVETVRVESGAAGACLTLSDATTNGKAMEYVGTTGVLTLRDSLGAAQITFNGETGAKSGVAHTRHYGACLLYAIEATEVWFEDVGEGRLEHGTAHVPLDPVFLETVTIDDRHPFRVFVTLTDPCEGVFVRKERDHFVVEELRGGRSHATFDWRVMAKRNGLTDARLEPLREHAAPRTPLARSDANQTATMDD